MDAALAAALARELGAAVASSRPLGGGDINDAYEVALADGRRVFVKTNARAPRAMFPAEARGPAWLGQAGVLRVPSVIAVSREDGDGDGDAPPTPPFLALELVTPGRPARDFDERLGRGLAALHRFGAPGFGLDHDNFVG